MILATNATRMELLRFKKKLVVAQKGHKLLKDKMDELVRHFLKIINEAKSLRHEVEEKLSKAYQSFLVARAVMSRSALEEAIQCPGQEIRLDAKVVPILNLRVPEFEIKKEGKEHCYGFIQSSGDLDFALKQFSELLPSLIKMAEIEKKVKDLALEIENTRRRVNALEYILIPNLKETVKYIGMKLSEMERGNLSRLMRVKEIVRGSEGLQ